MKAYSRATTPAIKMCFDCRKYIRSPSAKSLYGLEKGFWMLLNTKGNLRSSETAAIQDTTFIAQTRGIKRLLRK